MTRTMSDERFTKAWQRDADALAAGELGDPHALLGAHSDGDGGAIVRAWRPGAEHVAIRVEGGTDFGAELVHPAGVWAAHLDGAKAPLRYEVQARYPDGLTVSAPDAYAFPPTVGDLDLHLAGEGRHEEIYERLGGHPREVNGVAGTAFAVWAPAARSVAVVGDFNSWDGRLHPMRSLGSSGIWELFLPGVEPGALYKFEIRTQDGALRVKTDPYAREVEISPKTASVVSRSEHAWEDGAWLQERGRQVQHERPMSVYEVHLGSWRRDPDDPERLLSYAELADELAAYATDLGFTHVELLPVMAHPFTGSWGYQVTGYFAPDPRLGGPDDLKAFVDRMHGHGIGVLMDWVPAHFPRDDWALARFDGTALYEHEDPRRGAHPEWGTLVFNFGRNEVKNFLLASGLFWCEEYHADGLRVDAVASMLYLDYSRKAGEWIPNKFGGREDLEAVDFLKDLNTTLHAREPGIISAAEESTAWPGVSRPTYVGGLGFGFKWNMGWMHDTLDFFAHDPIHRRYHHHELTFSLMYAFSENFILPLSHDEVVHGKGTIYSRMPGDHWQKLANVRALYAYQWAHPGKQLLFMGQEFAQTQEWNAERSLDWHLLEDDPAADGGGTHVGVQNLVRDLNAAYKAEPALWQRDGDPEGFYWIEANDAENSVVAFARLSTEGRVLVCVMNLTPIPREGYRVGLPQGGRWREVLNTDAQQYGGSGTGNFGGVEAEDLPWHGQPHSAAMTLPPLGVLWFAPED
jgi:1,4-alpha-glucan branching enzyme